MKSLVIIPARSGSKGIPGKNIKLLSGKPLIEYTLDVAKELFSARDICVTTDSIDIALLAEKNGLPVPFIRPKDLSADTSSMYDVMLHALNFYRNRGEEYDRIILLQPTSPFRTKQNLQQAINLYTPETEMVVSVKETPANPYYVLYEEDSNGYLHKSKEGNFSSRQECPRVWQFNGAIYIINVSCLMKRSHLHFSKIRKYVMDEMNSLDIDSPLDWAFAEFCLSNNLITNLDSKL